MNEYKDVFGKINQMMEPLSHFTERINRAMEPIQKLNQAILPLKNRLNEIAKAYMVPLAKFNDAMKKIAIVAQKWQADRKADIAVLAEHGWYPNWFTFFYIPENEPKTLDELMVIQIKENWEDITDKILKLCPNRKHILKTAFDLHISGNYIAAIPLFYAQADGICCESLKSFLFAGDSTEKKIKELIESGEIEVTFLIDIFLEPFKVKNNHNMGISKSKHSKKNKVPNRNGILHGHRRYLDYGTEINSLKCFSLLSFIVYATKELTIGIKRIDSKVNLKQRH